MITEIGKTPESERPLPWQTIVGKMFHGAAWIPLRISPKGVDRSLTTWFLVDTGSSVSILSKQDAQKLGVPANIPSSADRHVVGLGENWTLNCKPLRSKIGATLRGGSVLEFAWDLRVPTDSQSYRAVSLLGLDLLAHFEKILIKNGDVNKVELSSTKLLELPEATIH